MRPRSLRRSRRPAAPYFAFALILLVAGCGQVDEDPTDSDPADHAAAVTALADRYVEAYFQAFPDEATAAGVAEADHDRLPDISSSARAAWEATEDSILAALEAIDAGTLPTGSAAAITHGFLGEVLRNARGFRTCRMELWNVSPTWTGWPSRMGGLAALQPVGTPEEREAAFRRFSELPRFVNQEIENLRAGIAEGFTAPRVNVEGVIRQVEALARQPLTDSPFQTLASEEDPGSPERWAALERDELRPAFERYVAFLRDEYLPEARTEIAVAANPGGADCYRAAIRFHATVAVAPEEVHRIGLEQMALIREEMAAIAQGSFDTDDVDLMLERLRTDPRYLVGGRDAMVAIAEDVVERAGRALPEWFGLLPEAEVVVQPVPSYAEEGAPFAYYNPPAEDGSRPGIYYINLRGAVTAPRAGVESTAFHEAHPGHHTQAAIAQERTDLHAVARYVFLSGFGEGWALYAERLSDEMGLFTSDVDRMGLLSNEALRAARLVVDAGMHALGWSRDEAIEYMLANTAESRGNVVAEVDRYIAVPGQATSYMLGSLEIMRLREMARSRLGEDFDIREFHDRVLEDGSVPLMMLRAKIERWVEASAS